MISKLIRLASALALPTLLAAQTPAIPNEHASDKAKAMVAAHSQGAQHRATHRRGQVERSANAATRAVPATRTTRAVPGSGDGAATPAMPARPATPTVPALPSRKPSDRGQSGSRRP